MSEWQPIETAPKDRALMLWFPAMASWVAGPWRGCWSHVYDEWSIHSPAQIDRKGLVFRQLPAAPTHWQPLAAAPKKGASMGGEKSAAVLGEQLKQIAQDHFRGDRESGDFPLLTLRIGIDTLVALASSIQVAESELARGLQQLRQTLWNAAIEAAALIVQPVPHVDEERTCAEVAAAIRTLKRNVLKENLP